MSCKPAFAAKEKKEYKRHPGVTGGRILAHKWLWAEGDKRGGEGQRALHISCPQKRTTQ